MTITDIGLIIALAVLALMAAFEVHSHWQRRRDFEAELPAAHNAGYMQALEDTADDRDAEDADIAEAMQEVYENRDWLRGRLGQVEEARDRAEADATLLRDELDKYIGKEPTVAEEITYLSSERARLEDEAARNHAAFRSARNRARRERTLNNNLVDELAQAHPAAAQAPIEYDGVPFGLDATAKEIADAVAVGIAPLVRRQADRIEKRDGGKARYAFVSFLPENTRKAADL